MAAASFEQRRQLVLLLIDRVIVTDAEVEIRYVLPTNPESEHVRFCHLRKDYFDDPALRQGHEAHAMAAANDLQSPAAGAGYRGRGGHTLVGAIGEDHLDERKQPARGAQ